MKLKLKNPGGAASGAPVDSTNASASASASANPTPTSAGPKLALKIKTSGTGDAPNAAAGAQDDKSKQKRKYTKKPKLDENGQPVPGAKSGSKPKKRPLEDGEDGAPAKRKSKPTLKSLERMDSEDEDDHLMAAPVRPPPSRPTLAKAPSVKLSLKTKGHAQSQRTPTIDFLKMKARGKPPPRPPGVGYDSEADEAEADPAIESQFVLRMEPGPDCDLLRKAIEEKTIGKKASEGGTQVRFRFLDRDGRRSIIWIQDRMYAATMVDLPCVIESLKSWNKKDWVKTADVCQMLLVLGRVNSEEEARKFPRPKTVEPDTHRYAHGITPPMHYVRNRRFRPRKSYHDVERIERQANALLQEDELAVSTHYEYIDTEGENESADGSFDEQGGQGDDMFDNADYAETPAEDAMDADALEQLLAEGLMDDDNVQFQDANGQDVDVDALFGNGGDTIEVETPIASSHSVAMHALAHNSTLVLEPESAASTPAAATSPDDEDDDDGDDDDDDDDVDPEVAAKQEQDEQIRAEIRELEEAIAESKAQLAATTNVLYKRRLQDRIDNQEKDRLVKLSLLGEEAEDD